jgi:hypothetical protein
MLGVYVCACLYVRSHLCVHVRVCVSPLISFGPFYRFSRNMNLVPSEDTATPTISNNNMADIQTFEARAALSLLIIFRSSSDVL